MKNEEEFFTEVSNKYKAEGFRITEHELFDSIIKNSIRIDFRNAIFNLDNPDNEKIVSRIIDSINQILNSKFKYSLIYRHVAISFSQAIGNLIAEKGNTVMKSYDYVPGKINEALYHNQKVRFAELSSRLYRQNKMDSLQKYCRSIPEKDTLYLDGLLTLAQVASKQHDTVSFVKCFKQLRNRRRDVSFIPLTLAKYYGDIYDFNTAFKYLDTTLSIDKHDPSAYYYRGLYKYYVSNVIIDAEPDIKKAIELGSEDAKIFMLNIEESKDKKINK